jgi:hypothetical protein
MSVYEIKPICHGDSITIRATVVGSNTSFAVKRFGITPTVMMVSDIHDPSISKDSECFVVGDQKKIGQPVNLGESVTLVSSPGYVPHFYDEKSGSIILTQGWGQFGMSGTHCKIAGTPVVFTCGYHAVGTPIHNTLPYFIHFDGRSHRKWGINENLGYRAIVDTPTKWCSFTVQKITSGTLAAAPKTPKKIFVPPKLYYTVDDSCSKYTQGIIDYINKEKIPVVFFINASHSEGEYYNALKSIASSPYATMAVHTYDHANMAHLTISESSNQIKTCMDLGHKAHLDQGLTWEPPYFFRFPFCDDGRNEIDSSTGKKTMNKYWAMQDMLKGFKFSRHERMQNSVFDSDIDMCGPFLNDGDQDDQTEVEFLKECQESFKYFYDNFPSMWNNESVIGTHDGKHTVTLLKTLKTQGVEFLDPQKDWK